MELTPEQKQEMRKRIAMGHKAAVQKAGLHIGKAVTLHGTHMGQFGKARGAEHAALECAAKAAAHAEKALALHTAHKAVGADYPADQIGQHIEGAHAEMKAMHGHLTTLQACHKEMHGSGNEMGDQQELAGGSIAKAMEAWGGVTPTSIAQPTEGEIPEYPSDTAYPGAKVVTPAATPAPAAPSNGGEGEVTEKEAQLREKLAAAEARVAILEKQPTVAKGVVFDATDENTRTEAEGERKGIFAAVDQVMKGEIDTDRVTEMKELDRRKLGAKLLGALVVSPNHVKFMSDSAMRTPHDVQPVAGNRNTSAVLPQATR